MNNIEPKIIKYTNNKKIYYWEEEYLWRIASSIDAIDINVEDFDYLLSENRWFSKGFPPNFKNLLHHISLINNANLDFPIILSPNHDILDGFHRLMKAKIIGLNQLKAVVLVSIPNSNVSIENLKDY